MYHPIHEIYTLIHIYISMYISSVKTLQAALGEVHHAGDEKTRATLARTLRLETMISIREICDAAEAVCPANLWTLATYKELLFIDQHVE
jgi:glutamine synthetase